MKKYTFIIIIIMFSINIFSQKILIGENYEKIIGKNKNYKYLIFKDTNYVFTIDFKKNYTVGYIFKNDNKNSICNGMFLDFKSKKLEKRFKKKLTYKNQIEKNIWIINIKKKNIIVIYSIDENNNTTSYNLYYD